MNKLKLLTDSEIEQIHNATLEILGDIGIKFTQKEALDIFEKAGFEVKDNIVKFKKKEIEETIKKVPTKFTRKSLDGKHDIEIGNGKLYMGGSSVALYVVDPDTYKRRKANLNDLYNFTRLIDSLEYLHIGNGVVKPDVPDSIMSAIWNRNACLNTVKPSCCWYALDKQTAIDTINVLSAAVGGLEELKKMKTWAVSVALDSALTWGHSIWGLIEMAKVEIPIEILPMPFCGSVHPVTIAGTLAQVNAEAISAIVLSQIINPGCPIIYAASYGGIMDMQTGMHALATPETALYQAAATQLSKWYNFPTNMTTPTVDSKVPDAQASYERMMTVLVTALAGVDCMSLIGGMLDFGLSASYEQMVIDNEIAGQVLRIVKGFEVNKETLAIDVVKEVGHAGNYLSHEHTLKHFKNEFWFPKLADRQSRGSWELKGSKDILKRAKEKVNEILSQPHKKAISEEREKEVNRVVKEIIKREKIDFEI